MTRIAVIGATGTAGSRTVSTLKQRGIEPVEISRSAGVDLITGKGLHHALAGVEVAIDTSNAYPTDDSVDLHDAMTSATRHVVETCTAQGVKHLVFLSISGIENPVFDELPYYVAKRDQEQIVATGAVPATIVKATQLHEFATIPAVVSFSDDDVCVHDWLIQPIAADSVADVLVNAALGQPQATTLLISGPQTIRLPELTARYLQRIADQRRVRAVPADLPALTDGVLQAPREAAILGPDVDTWLRDRAMPHAHGTVHQHSA